MSLECDFTNIKETYQKMTKEEKREIRKSFKELLENSTIPLGTLFYDIFNYSINDLVHKKALSKTDQAGILSFYYPVYTDKKNNKLFLKVIKHLFTNYEQSKNYIKKDNWNRNIIYRGRRHVLNGVKIFFDKLINPAKKYNNNLFMKFDIVRSSVLLGKYPHKFQGIQLKILKKIMNISTQYDTEMFMSEGDALYFIFNGAYKDYPRYCKNLVLFGIKVLQWIEYYNNYDNTLKDDVELRIIGLSIPITGDNQKKKAKEKLSLIEEEYAEPGCIFIDKFIAWKLPFALISRFSTKTILSAGQFHYYKSNLSIEKVPLKNI